MITLLIIGHIAVWIASYLLIRKCFGREHWTIGDRAKWLLLNGVPFLNIVFLVLAGLDGFDWDKKAKW
jgi:hypothetical protein